MKIAISVDRIKYNYGEIQAVKGIKFTPVTQGEIFVSKSSIGILTSILMGVVTLLLNSAFHSHFGLIIFILSLGAVMAGCFGLILGAFVNDMAALYSAIKGLGIFLYGPGLVAMFPQIPQWLGKLFPTYYIINPIFEITQKNGEWAAVKADIYILSGFLFLLILITAGVALKTEQQKA